MAAQVVTAEELIECPAGTVNKYGNMPVTINSAASSAVESVGPPTVLPVIPAGEEDGFQAYKYSRPEDKAHIKATLIN